MKQKHDNFGDVTAIAEIPEGAVLTVAVKCALLEQYCHNGGRKVSREHAQHIIEEFSYPYEP